MTPLYMLSQPKKISHWNKRHGFTLVEVLLYFGLLSFFLLSLFTVFGMVLEAEVDSFSTAHLEQNGLFILSRLRYDLLQADALILPALPGETTSILELQQGGETLRYSVTDGKLLLDRGGLQHEVSGLDTQVSVIEFQRLGSEEGNPSVQIRIDLQSTIPRANGAEIRTYQQTVSLR